MEEAQRERRLPGKRERHASGAQQQREEERAQREPQRQRPRRRLRVHAPVQHRDVQPVFVRQEHDVDVLERRLEQLDVRAAEVEEDVPEPEPQQHHGARQHRRPEHEHEQLEAALREQDEEVQPVQGGVVEAEQKVVDVHDGVEAVPKRDEGVLAQPARQLQ